MAAKTVSPNGINDYLESNNSGKLSQNEFIANIIKRNEVELKSLLENDSFKENELAQRILRDSEAMNQIEIEIKYKGYIDRQTVQIESFVRNEEIRIRLTSNTRRSNHFRPRQLRNSHALSLTPSDKPCELQVCDRRTFLQ
ncbi:MAG: hypothetical protein IPL67_15405 [Ignavibacteria bacterium]|nr:hypothetical protein [Ignavibacteria bacterium]